MTVRNDMATPALQSTVDSANRRIAARTMDGFKICAKLSVRFFRPVQMIDADATLSLYARAFARALEDQVSDGRLPLQDAVLHERMTKAVDALPREHVRLTELHVGGNGASAPSMPAVTRASVLTSEPPRVSTGAPASPPRAASGIVLAQGRRDRPASGFALALERTTGPLSAVAAGNVLASSLSNAAASLLLGALAAVSDSVEDPLRFVDGRVDRRLQHALITEAAACVSFLLFEALTSRGIAQKMAVQVTEAASATAVMGQRVPSSEISRYLALGSPVHGLTERFCLLLGVKWRADIEQRLDFSVNTVRAEARLAAELLRGRAAPPG